MTDTERIERRLSAVERAVIDGDLELTALDDVATLAENLEALTERIDAHERRIAELEGRIAELEGRIDAFDGFVGSVESVNETVERRANGAVAAVDRLEYRIDELERVVDTGDPGADGDSRATREGSANEHGEKTETGAGAQNRDEAAGIRRKTDAPSDRSRDRTDRGAIAPVVTDDTADDSLPVERVATEIVATPGTDGGSSDRGLDLADDGRSEPPTASDDSARSRREATQDSLETRLAEPSVTDRSSEGPSSDEDDEPRNGLIQSIRSKLP